MLSGFQRMPVSCLIRFHVSLRAGLQEELVEVEPEQQPAHAPSGRRDASGRRGARRSAGGVGRASGERRADLGVYHGRPVGF